MLLENLSSGRSLSRCSPGVRSTGSPPWANDLPSCVSPASAPIVARPTSPLQLPAQSQALDSAMLKPPGPRRSHIRQNPYAVVPKRLAFPASPAAASDPTEAVPASPAPVVSQNTSWHISALSRSRSPPALLTFVATWLPRAY